jgi:hypothetical protein
MPKTEQLADFSHKQLELESIGADPAIGMLSSAVDDLLAYTDQFEVRRGDDDVPVLFHHAACSSAERISFRQINRRTGNRLRQQLIDEETREVVETYDKARGYEIGKGRYLLVEDEELEAIEAASTHTIDIDSFVACGSQACAAFASYSSARSRY